MTFLENIPLKKKGRVIYIGLVVLGFLTYQFSIKNSIKLSRDVTNLRSTESRMDVNLSEQKVLEQKAAFLESKFGIDKEDEASGYIIDCITKGCQQNNLSLLEMPAVLIQEDGNSRIETHKFVLAGNYSNLLKFNYSMEKEYSIGHVPSVHYETRYNYKEKKTELVLSLFVQRFKKIES